jgi:thiol-disulfide isomerase/thioredoxin
MLYMKRILAMALIGVGILIGGCGIQPAGNPPVQNLLKKNVIKPLDTFNVKKVNNSTEQGIPVVTADGQKQVLDAVNQPVLFEAYWCPHCQRTLLLLAKHRTELKTMPTIVSTGFAKGTTLKQAVSISEQEFKKLGISLSHVTYLIGPNAAEYEPKLFPTLVFPYQGGVGQLQGEHTLAVWMKALGPLGR